MVASLPGEYWSLENHYLAIVDDTHGVVKELHQREKWLKE